MEEAISVLALVAGLAGITSTLISLIRVSYKNYSIKIKFGHKDKDPEVKVIDIRHLTVAEIEQIKARLSDLELQNGEVSRLE